jgi:hypothetical protein
VVAHNVEHCQHACGGHSREGGGGV